MQKVGKVNAMTSRDKGKKVYQDLKKKTSELKSQARTKIEASEGLSKALEKAEDAGKNQVQHKAESTIKGYMGFDDYRKGLESALEEALIVIAAQEERIRLLEERLLGKPQ
jgi:hypothetical protein